MPPRLLTQGYGCPGIPLTLEPKVEQERNRVRDENQEFYLTCGSKETYLLI